MGKIKDVFRHIRIKAKYCVRDRVWYMTGGGCWGGKPPSFYALHTPEEAQEIIMREQEEIRKMIEELD